MRSGRVAYRVKQFASAFTVRMRPQEREEVTNLLLPEELALFYGMRRPALRHALQVYRLLRLQGTPDRDLLAAALLHDVGKGRVTVAHRVAAVLLETSAPALLDRIASPMGPRWRQGFFFHRHHAELGAELVERAGSNPTVVALVRDHHREGRASVPGLTELQKADEDS